MAQSPTNASGKLDILPNLMDMENIISEVVEREKRKNNLIIFNLPEVGKITRTEQAAADTAAVQDILIYLDVSADVSYPIRLAKYDPTNVLRKRPLKITLSSTAAINEVLRDNKKLRESERFKSIYIAKHRTPHQINLYKSVKQQLNARLSSGETALTIRYIHT